MTVAGRASRRSSRTLVFTTFGGVPLVKCSNFSSDFLRRTLASPDVGHVVAPSPTALSPLCNLLSTFSTLPPAAYDSIHSLVFVLIHRVGCCHVRPDPDRRNSRVLVGKNYFGACDLTSRSLFFLSYFLISLCFPIRSIAALCAFSNDQKSRDVYRPYHRTVPVQRMPGPRTTPRVQWAVPKVPVPRALILPACVTLHCIYARESKRRKKMT